MAATLSLEQEALHFERQAEQFGQRAARVRRLIAQQNEIRDLEANIQAGEDDVSRRRTQIRQFEEELAAAIADLDALKARLAGLRSSAEPVTESSDADSMEVGSDEIRRASSQTSWTTSVSNQGVSGRHLVSARRRSSISSGSNRQQSSPVGLPVRSRDEPAPPPPQASLGVGNGNVCFSMLSRP